MSVLIITDNISADEVKNVKEILYALGADVIRYQRVDGSALPDLQNLFNHDFAVLIQKGLSPEHVNRYRSYIQDTGISNLKIY